MRTNGRDAIKRLGAVAVLIFALSLLAAAPAAAQYGGPVDPGGVVDPPVDPPVDPGGVGGGSPEDSATGGTGFGIGGALPRTGTEAALLVRYAVVLVVGGGGLVVLTLERRRSVIREAV